ncbi:MAG: winged helix-turn-helix transcriptional regulator [Gammaproteobacteria bacterium]|nr:winged helix-turn-helix transcriptional regulator [Gammaproteobacteria bacterium]
MSERRYHQYCPVARGLEMIGGRWTLLIFRELAFGAKRYKDLLDGLPGIGTNLLAGRLKDLEADGLVRRAYLPPPAASTVYELTDEGRAVQPVLDAVARLGVHRLVPPRRRDKHRAHWAALGLKASFRPDEAGGVRESYEFHVDGEIFHVTVADGQCTAAPGPADHADLVIHAPMREMGLIAGSNPAAEDVFRSPKVTIKGDKDALQRCYRIFGLGRNRARA